jgi:probable HAF family extracellular repeat protein
MTHPRSHSRLGTPARLRPLVAAIGLAVTSLLAPAHAAPVVAHWTVTDLGTLGGSMSSGYGMNAAGQVTGYSYTAGNAAYRSFSYSNGTMADLGTLGGTYSIGQGINAAGQVTGFASTTANAAQHAFLYSNGAMTDLGTLGGTYSYGQGINAAGQVAGYANTAGNAAYHAYLYSNGAMTDLGTLGGTYSYGYGINAAGQVTGLSQTTANAASHAFLYSNGTTTDLGTLGGTSSVGQGINAAGQVTGYASTTGNAATHAFLNSYGTMTDLGTLGGTNSYGNGINAAGQVTGQAYTTGNAAYHAFLYSNGTMTDLNTFNGVVGSGVTLTSAQAINDAGQIVATGSNNHAQLLTLDTTVWEGGSYGSFSSTSGWSYLTAPNKNTAVFIDPTVSATIYGPSVATDVKQLTVGGDGTGNNGIATLVLYGGTLNVLGNAGQFTTVNVNGVLTGDGSINGAVINAGTVNATNLALPGGLTNAGIVTGNGRLNASLTNTTVGLLRVGAGQLLKLTGAAHSNGGNVEVRAGGELQVSGGFTNAAAGRVVLDNGLVRFNGGLTNNGQLQVSFGGASVFGAVTTNGGGKIILSANSNTAFYDAVDVKNGGELRVSAGSTAVFFGQVFQRTGSLFTGTGTKYYEGGYSPGSSPGAVFDEGSVFFTGGNAYLAEIGGLLPGAEHDALTVAGALGFGGTLKLVSWAGFTGQAGQRFDLFNGGSFSGQFSSIDTSGLLLAPGTALDISQLYVDGSIGIAAVPEPGSWALLLAGMAWGGVASAATPRRLSARRRPWPPGRRG